MFVSLYEAFPEIAQRETRSITVLPRSDAPVPPGEYGFLELYCEEAGCDCRRVMFVVVKPGGTESLATIGWGWEDPAFYEQWCGESDPAYVTALKGPALNLGSPECAFANGLLDLVRYVLLRDEDYVKRVKRHYAMMRRWVDGSGAREKQSGTNQKAGSSKRRKAR